MKVHIQQVYMCALLILGLLFILRTLTYILVYDFIRLYQNIHLTSCFTSKVA